MPGLMRSHVAPDGRRMMVDGDLLAIDDRIKNGDATVGWAGDPGLWLEFDQVRNVFIVCRWDANTGRNDDVMSYPPPLDAGLLIKLRDGDTQRAGNDPFARMVAAEDAADAAKQAELEAYLTEEAAPRLVHSMAQAGADVPVKSQTFFGPPSPVHAEREVVTVED